MTEIVDGVHQVDGVNANSYLVFDKDGSLILVDTGMAKDGKKIAEYIRSKLGRQLSDVKTIVLTHCHMDHSRGAASPQAITESMQLYFTGKAYETYRNSYAFKV